MWSLLSSTAIFAVASATCHHGTTLFRRADGAASSSFGYTGKTGAVTWHTLDPAWETCATGRHQSPINIVPGADHLTEVAGSSLSFRLEDQYQGAELENLGTTIQVGDPTGSIVRDGKTYELKQYHFHTTSEHTFEDEAFSLEIHFVFQAADESLSVVGIPIDVADHSNMHSPFLTAVLEKADQIPTKGDTTTTYPAASGDVRGHVGKSRVYQYAGSLTTPPCSEGVAWNVVADPMYVLPSSYRKAKKVLGFNARFTQAEPGADNLLAHGTEMKCVKS